MAVYSQYAISYLSISSVDLPYQFTLFTGLRSFDTTFEYISFYNT